MKPPTDTDLIVRAAEATVFGPALSRRQFLILSACAVTGAALMNVRGFWGSDAPLIIIDNAKGLILADPTRCVGCLRCELACTEFNDGQCGAIINTRYNRDSQCHSHVNFIRNGLPLATQKKLAANVGLPQRRGHPGELHSHEYLQGPAG